MKNRNREAPRATSDDLRPEYRFDYCRSRPNRFADRLGAGRVVVVLEPDVASFFKDSASVNELLRSVARAMRPGKPRKAPPRSARRRPLPAGPKSRA